VTQNIICPKDDSLRMIKAALYAAKTIHQLRQVNAWAICETLETRDPRRKGLYQDLKDSLTLLEIFRYLYQLMIAQEEEINLDNPHIRDNLGLIATVLDIRRMAPLQPLTFYSPIITGKFIRPRRQ